MEKKFIKFANPEQVILYEMELKGQISDGHWENSGPRDHWHDMCDAEARCDGDGETGVFGFRPRRKYGFASASLLSVVGTRMLNYVRMHQVLGYTLEQIRTAQHFFDLDGNFVGAPTYEGKYWDDVREQLKAFDAEAVRRATEHGGYSMERMKRDLREMSEVVNDRGF